MKYKKWIYALCCCLFLLPPWLLAQDRIHLKNGDILDVKVENVSGRRIGYFVQEDGTAAFKTIKTSKVKSIIYSDGTRKEISPIYKDPSLYINQNKQALKIHLLAPMQGHTSFSYERNLRPGQALEYSLGMIGLGENDKLYYQPNGTFQQLTTRVNQKGLHVGLGCKIYTDPPVRFIGQRYKHLLEGWYLMPKVIAGSFTRNIEERQNGFGRIENKRFHFASLMMYGGKQTVYFGSVLLEWQLGIGYGRSNQDWSEETDSNYYLLRLYPQQVAIGGGIRLGFLF
jgi:hypothetical protein